MSGNTTFILFTIIWCSFIITLIWITGSWGWGWLIIVLLLAQFYDSNKNKEQK